MSGAARQDGRDVQSGLFGRQNEALLRMTSMRAPMRSLPD
jgi:hypothetical protein